MYITNDPQVARIAQSAGVQRIFVDMEVLGKARRQRGLDTVQNAHTLQDVAAVREVLATSQLLVRVNSIHEPHAGFPGSKAEIDGAIAAGADIIMLPYFHTVGEVQTFLELVDGRVRTCPLLETAEAVELIDDIIALPGIDEVFVGLNDLSLSYGQSFMFEPLANGTVAHLAEKFNDVDIPWGFGGIASLGRGMLHSERIIAEHYCLGSESVILSRSFCNVKQVADLDAMKVIFDHGVRAIRDYEVVCAERLKKGDCAFFSENRAAVRSAVDAIVAAQHQGSGRAADGLESVGARPKRVGAE